MSGFRSALVGGAFGALVALAFSGVLIGFLALNNSGTTGAVVAVVIAVVGFTVGFGVEHRRGS